MFQELIRSTPFTTEAASACFASSITGESWNGDYTFLSTIRALLGHRLKENEKINLNFRRCSYPKDYISGYSPKDRVQLIISDLAERKNNICIVNICNSDAETNDAWVQDMQENFPKVYGDYTYLEKVTVFFRKICYTACFVNAKTKSTIFLISQMTARRMHYIQSGIPAYLPWYFNPADGITEDERNLLNSFREKSGDLYVQILSRIAEGFDFEVQRIKELLTGFETRYERIRLNQERMELERIRRAITDLNERISASLRQMRDKEIVICGLDDKIKSGSESNDMMDYFIANKHLILRAVNETTMEFVVKASLDFFDEELAAKFLGRDGSYFYEYADRHGIMNKENIRMLMTEIFLNQRLKVNVCAAYNLRLEGNVSALSHYDEYGGECAEYTPNPHIDQYHCLGTHERLINERLMEHDYISAIAQCITSCKSLNLADSAVMSEFMKRICGGRPEVNMRCIVLPMGLVVTPQDAVKWLLKEKEDKEKAERETSEAAAAPEAEAPAEDAVAETAE